MTIKELKQKTKELGLSYRRLSDISGVPISTIQKIFSGATPSPRYETLQALEQALFPFHHLSENEAHPGSADLTVAEPRPGLTVSPEQSIQKKQGEYTLEDYLALPDDRRVELIDGFFYDMATPTGYHQFLAGEIFHSLRSQTNAMQSHCRPFISPLDVQLDCDDRTVVQPDVIGTCDSSRFQDGRYFGAPPLVIEVLSPSTRRKDIYIKGAKYANAGVREYWIIDLKEKRVMVNVFEEDIAMRIYGISDVIPVHISDGKVQVDFGEIYADLIDYFPELKKS